MLSDKQKQDQLQAEIGLHIIRTLLPIDDSEKGALQTCYPALKQLHDNTLETKAKADALNTILNPLSLKFEFLTDENAKEYIKNNPNVFQTTWIGAQFLCYPWPGDHPEFKYMKKLVDSVYEEVNSEKTTALDGLMAIQHALGAGMMMLQFRRGEKIKMPEQVKVEK